MLTPSERLAAQESSIWKEDAECGCATIRDRPSSAPARRQMPWGPFVATAGRPVATVEHRSRPGKGPEEPRGRALSGGLGAPHTTAAALDPGNGPLIPAGPCTAAKTRKELHRNSQFACGHDHQDRNITGPLTASRGQFVVLAYGLGLVASPVSTVQRVQLRVSRKNESRPITGRCCSMECSGYCALNRGIHG
jgi:hypothetical protein